MNALNMNAVTMGVALVLMAPLAALAQQAVLGSFPVIVKHNVVQTSPVIIHRPTITPHLTERLERPPVVRHLGYTVNPMGPVINGTTQCLCLLGRDVPGTMSFTFPEPRMNDDARLTFHPVFRNHDGTAIAKCLAMPLILQFNAQIDVEAIFRETDYQGAFALLVNTRFKSEARFVSDAQVDVHHELPSEATRSNTSASAVTATSAV